jgi:hypothetical protein
MGKILQAFGLESKPLLEAQSAPQVLGEYSPYAMPFQSAYIGRTEAMSVPALMRCRNLLAGTIGSIPLELYKKSTNEELGSPAWLEQPSYSQPRSSHDCMDCRFITSLWSSLLESCRSLSRGWQTISL